MTWNNSYVTHINIMISDRIITAYLVSLWDIIRSISIYNLHTYIARLISLVMWLISGQIGPVFLSFIKSLKLTCIWPLILHHEMVHATLIKINTNALSSIDRGLEASSLTSKYRSASGSTLAASSLLYPHSPSALFYLTPWL